MEKMRMSASFTCCFEDQLATIPLQNDLSRFLQHISEHFHVDDQDIVGFQEGTTVYPASYVGLVGADEFAGHRLTLLVRLGSKQQQQLENHHHHHQQQHQHVKKRQVKFFLVGNQSVLMTSKDLIGISLLVQSFAELNITGPALVNLVMSFRSANFIRKGRFDEMVREYLCPAGLGTEEQMATLHTLYERIFFSLDKAGAFQVFHRDLVACLMVMAAGRQRDKFVMIFDLYDTDKDGFLNRVEINLLIATLLTLMMAVNDGMSKLPSDYVYSLIDETSEAITEGLVRSINKTHHISVTDFLEWYFASGRSLMPWVEVFSRAEAVGKLLEWKDKQQSPSRDVEDVVGNRRPRTSDSEDASKIKASYFVDEDGDGETDSDDDESVELQDRAAMSPIKKTREEEEDGEEQSSDVLFRFSLFGDHELVLTADDGELVDLIISTTLLGDIPVEELHETFLANVEEPNKLTKAGFDKSIRNLVPRHRLEKQEQRYLSYTFSTFFYAFDRNHTDSVPLDEFVSGFSLFSRGNKSTKLALSWALFSEHTDGRVDSIGFVRFIRSFLTFLFALQKDASRLDANSIYATIDRTAIESTREMYQWLGKGDNEFIDFESFGNWYNASGQQRIIWLELLDLKRWPVDSYKPTTFEEEEDGGSTTSGTYFDDESSSEGEEEEDNDEDDGEKDDDENQLIFQIPLFPEKGLSLSIRSRDVLYLENILNHSNIDMIEPDEIHAALLRESRGSDITISRTSFCSCIKKLLKIATDEAFQPIEIVLLKVFNLYDIHRLGRVPTVEIAVGISFLAGGNKSDKLALGFALFDRNRDGKLNPGELSSFLSALLLALYGFTNKVNILSNKDIWNEVDESVSNASKQIVEGSSDPDGNVTFEEFAQFYSERGYDVIPWIELFDLRKWPFTSDGKPSPRGAMNGGALRSRSSSSSGSPGGAANVLEPPSGVTSVDDEKQRKMMIVLSFDLSDDVRLQLYHSDIEWVQSMAALSGLATMSITKLEEMLDHYADYDEDHHNMQVINKPQFENFVRHEILKPSSQMLRDAQRRWLFNSFMNIYQVYASAEKSQSNDPEEVTAVPYNKLFAGLVLFVTGKKSDKLCALFAKFDIDEDGRLTRSQLHSYFLSFLLILCTCDVCNDDSELNEENRRNVRSFDALSECVIELVATIFTQTNEVRAMPNLISFSDFAGWYTNGLGFRIMPYLELLDLAKWQMLLDKNADGNSTISNDFTIDDEDDYYDDSDEEGNEDDDVVCERVKLGEAPVDESEGGNTVFRFYLTTKGDLLEFLQSDVFHLKRLIQLTTFKDIKPERICELFRKIATPNVQGPAENHSLFITKEAFDRAIRDIIPGNSLTGNDKAFLSLTLSSIFLAYDRQHELKVPFLDFTCGFLLLGHGAKSEKLALAFELFAGSESGNLSRHRFARFLGSFLTMLSALNENLCEQPAESVWELVDESVMEVTEIVFSDLRIDVNIDFEKFATWYTEGFGPNNSPGHEVIPWLELLSLTKWPSK